MRFLAIAPALLVLIACQTTSVRPVVMPVAERIEEVCIERNNSVEVADFLQVMEAGFNRNGVRTRIFDSSPAPCPVRVTYTATRRWDFVAFLSNARISIYRDHELVGEATYDLPSGAFGGGGADPGKWRSTAQKIDPPMDQMLAANR